MSILDFFKKARRNISSPSTSICPIARKIVLDARTLQTDLVALSVDAGACSECAKYQGRVFSLTGSSKLFPRVPNVFYQYGGIHEGCSHTFSPYIHEVNDPDLRYTLSIHELKDTQYGKNIIAFSNRPFVDDRTERCRKEAELTRQRIADEFAQRQYWAAHQEEFRAKLAIEEQDFAWLQANLPDKCPKSISGFRRMKTQNTKNYQALQQAAAELGRNL